MRSPGFSVGAVERTMVGPGPFGVRALAGSGFSPPDPGCAGGFAEASGGCSRKAPAFSCAWRRASTCWRSWTSLPQAWVRYAARSAAFAFSKASAKISLTSLSWSVFIGELVRGQAAQFPINQRQQFRARARFAALDCLQHAGHVSHSNGENARERK